MGYIRARVYPDSPFYTMARKCDGYVQEHRLIMAEYLGRCLTKDEIVHHIDRNILNDNPKNLLLCNIHNHSSYHPEVAKRMRENNPSFNMNEDWKRKIGISGTGKKRTNEQKKRYSLSKLGNKNPRWNPELHKEIINHRIKNVYELDELQDVFCMEVPGVSWFYANDVLVHNCSFCQWPPVMYNNKLRERSIENIEAEIKYLIEKYGKNIFLYFDDDTFNLKEERTLQIAKMIKKYDLKWSAMCRIDTLSKSAWKECYDCGLTYVNIGIETANSRLLKIINKKLNIKEAEDKINYLKKLGMYIHCTFTWGIPGETKEDVLETREFFKRINVQSKQESKVQPLPGTPWWKSIKSKDRLSYDGYNELDITRKEYHL